MKLFGRTHTIKGLKSSKTLQEAVIAAGGVWSGGSTDVYRIRSGSIYVDDNKVMYYTLGNIKKEKAIMNRTIEQLMQDVEDHRKDVEYHREALLEAQKLVAKSFTELNTKMAEHGFKITQMADKREV